MAFLRFALAALCVARTTSEFVVWPPPQSAAAEGSSLSLDPHFAIRTRFASAGDVVYDGNQIAQTRLTEASERYNAGTASLSPPKIRSKIPSALHSLDVVVLSDDSHLVETQSMTTTLL